MQNSGERSGEKDAAQATGETSRPPIPEARQEGAPRRHLVVLPALSALSRESARAQVPDEDRLEEEAGGSGMVISDEFAARSRANEHMKSISPSWDGDVEMIVITRASDLWWLFAAVGPLYTDRGLVYRDGSVQMLAGPADES